MKDWLEHLIQISEAAGLLILKYYQNQDLQVSRKSDRSVVTEADKEANDYIVSCLQKLAPHTPIISEEKKYPEFQERKNWTEFWLVDPLDGTKEFINGLDEFTVNIALIRGGVPTIGVIHVPVHNVTYFAADGLGTWKKDAEGRKKRIYSNPTSHSKRSVVIVESRSHTTPEQEEMVKEYVISKRIKAGSSLKFCYVAEGVADIYPRLAPTMEWDVAAGDCIYRNSARVGRNPSTLTYNKENLKNSSFMIGVKSE